MSITLKDDNLKHEVLRLHNEEYNYSKIANITGLHPTTISRFLSGKIHKEWWVQNQRPIASGRYLDEHSNLKHLHGSRFIFTSAQNNTYVHQKFLKSLENFAEFEAAQIIIGTFTYNKNGFQNLTKTSDGIWYDPLIKDYIVNEPVLIANDLLWCGELNILPTKVNPLSGLFSYPGGRSGIVPHSKNSFESLPRHPSEEPKFMYTTGAVTKRNYIQKLVGQKASFHHSFSAIFIEVDDDGVWFARQLVADSITGEFYDLDRKITPNGITTNHRIEAINYGDLHSEKRDDEVYRASFSKSSDNSPISILDYLRPKYQFCNDTLDFEARNHHNRNDPYFRFMKYKEGNDSVKNNILTSYNVLKEMNRDFCQTIVVESNHDLAIERWLKEADYKTDPANAIFFLELQTAKYKALDNLESLNLFKYALTCVQNQNDCFLDDIVFLDEDESFRICDDEGNGIECGCHGHTGNNGTRGSVQSFRIRSSRYNVGHSHTACIKDGVYYAGVSGKLNMGYNKGGTTWSHSHILTYENGKRTIITIKHGRYKASN